MSAGRLTIRRAGYSLPFDVFDQRLAQKNHGQTLERLEERGGVSPVEAVALISWKHWSRFPEAWFVQMILTPPPRRAPERSSRGMSPDRWASVTRLLSSAP